MLAYLHEVIGNCDGVYEDGGQYFVNIAAGGIRPVTDAEILAATKTYRIASIRAEARTRIEATYPEWRQRSAALGVYPPEYVAQMQEGIAAVIAASNAGEDAVDAAVDVAAVEAVTVTWPVL